MPIHVVKTGETVYSIAQIYKVSADRIVYDNELAAQQNLVPGQEWAIGILCGRFERIGYW